MQYPRRTSEFQEEPGTATKRNSRSTQQRQSRIARPASIDRQTLVQPNSVTRGSRTTPQKQLQPAFADVPSTACKTSSSKGSRVARPTSLERQTLGLASSALRGSRTTPQKTPSRSGSATRVLFTAEKQRPSHTDKVWVQERAQQIVDHLRETNKPGAVHGLPYEFFSRSGCLRQMSTKQFVGIINHFLNYIWGSRFTVGSNYIDDLINILQKLQYPYQVNKSWLKTPTTSNSFGLTIQLFDFLMDFVPPQNEEQAALMQFDFEDPHDLTQSSLMHESPDANFTALMLKNCEEGFKLWDKQMDDDLYKLQQQTCDVLIYKRCGLEGVAALDEELQKLKKDLTEEQKKRPNIRQEDEELRKCLENELKETKENIREQHETLEVTNKKLSEMQAERQHYKGEFMQLVEMVAQLQSTLSNQKMTVEQRDALIEELEQRKHTLQCMERTLHDLEGRQHHQQVVLSRHKKQLTDQIYKYNEHIHVISSTLLKCDSEALLLSLNPQHEEVEERIKLLEKLRDRSEKQLQESTQQLEDMEKQLEELNRYINTTLRLENSDLEMALKRAERKIKEFEERKQEQISALDKEMNEVEERLLKLQTELKNVQDLKREKKMLLAELEKQNEELMNRAEQNYKRVADEREAFLNDYEKALERSDKLLSDFNELVEQREQELRLIEEEESKK